MILARLFIAMFVWALTIPALAEPLLTPHTAVYKVKISVVSGELNTELRKTADGYVANHVVRATGLSRLLTRGTIDVTSEFSIDAGGVKAIRYKAIDTIGDNPDADLEFDWSTNEASGTVGGENVLLKLDGIAHDSVSIQYALMHDLLNGTAAAQYTLFDVDELSIVNISNVGSKTVTTGAGKFTALGIRHQKEGSSRATTLWCVEELDFLPVIIEQHKDGKLKFRATLVTYTPIRE